MKAKERTIESLGALLVFTAFTISVLLVLLAGAKAYRAVTEADEAAYTARTAAQYIATRVRQADSAGTLRVEEMEGVSVLVIGEEIEGELYETWVYLYDGSLTELYAAPEAGLGLADGAPILPAGELTFALTGGVLKVNLNGEALTFVLRSGREVA